MLKNIKWVFLDLDDTLYDYERINLESLDFVFNDIHKLTNISLDCIKNQFQISRKIIHSQLHGQGASHHRILYFQNFCEALRIPVVPNALIWDELFWNHFLDKMVLRDGVIDFLKFLKYKEVIITIITDLISTVQFRKLEKLNIQPYIDYIVTSEEVGVEKPDKKIFLYSINKSKAQINQSIMIGDNYDKDVLGSQNIGMKAIHFDRNKRAENSISNFQELLEKFYE